VANIVERLKEFKPSPEEEQKVFNCARHGEKLQLFCRKDMMAICWLCERSQEHRGHKTALIEEVAQEYKVRRGVGGWETAGNSTRWKISTSCDHSVT
jgi:tripartite motif-containing protein 5